MTDEIYIYMTQLPDGIKSFSAPCSGGYTVYIDPRLDQEQQIEAYRHELEHIESGDFDGGNTQEIEAHAHKGG